MLVLQSIVNTEFTTVFIPVDSQFIVVYNI